jgi:hypothetical protein
MQELPVGRLEAPAKKHNKCMILLKYRLNN